MNITSLNTDILNYIGKLLYPTKYLFFRKSSFFIYKSLYLKIYMDFLDFLEYDILDALLDEFYQYIPYILENKLYIYEDYYKKIFKKTIKLSILNKKIGLFKYLLTKYNISNREIRRLFLISTKYGHLDMIQQLYHIFNDRNISDIISNTFFIDSCENGYLDIVKFYISINISHPSGIDSACKYGHLDIVKYLYNIGDKITTDSIIMSCRSNNIDLLKFIFNLHLDVEYSNDLLYNACNYNCNNLFIKYILDNVTKTKPYTDDDLYFFLQDYPNKNNPNLIDILHKHGFYLTPNVINFNCYYNRYHNVNRLLELKCPINDETLSYAVFSNNLEMVKLINNIEHKYIKDKRHFCLYLATIENKPEIIEYLHNSLKWEIKKC